MKKRERERESRETWGGVKGREKEERRGVPRQMLFSFLFSFSFVEERSRYRWSLVARVEGEVGHVAMSCRHYPRFYLEAYLIRAINLGVRVYSRVEAFNRLLANNRSKRANRQSDIYALCLSLGAILCMDYLDF